jgi:hypothetical protein
MAARDDFGSGYEMWFGEMDPNSAGLTRQQCMEDFARLGLVDAAVGKLDEFARVTGHKFGTHSVATEKPVTIPAQTVKPDSRQGTAPSTKDTTTTAAPKPRFPELFAQEFATRWARLRAAPFRPFSFKQSGKTVNVETRAQGEKLANECQAALDEGRTYR